MTNQEINERVAKLCGWTNIAPCTCKIELRGKDPNGCSGHILNYAESLDACREFESGISGSEDVSLYEHYLGEITESDSLAIRRSFVGDRMKLIRATPLQRCEAFLRLKGQWE